MGNFATLVRQIYDRIRTAAWFHRSDSKKVNSGVSAAGLVVADRE
jgi:hypothetical protein